jgi:hypothetical protein
MVEQQQLTNILLLSCYGAAQYRYRIKTWKMHAFLGRYCKIKVKRIFSLFSSLPIRKLVFGAQK